METGSAHVGACAHNETPSPSQRAHGPHTHHVAVVCARGAQGLWPKLARNDVDLVGVDPEDGQGAIPCPHLPTEQLHGAVYRRSHVPLVALPRARQHPTWPPDIKGRSDAKGVGGRGGGGEQETRRSRW